MSNIFLFTGVHAYALDQEKRRWIREFQTKHGPENLTLLEAAGLSFREFLDEISAAPFIAEKRLVLVVGVPHFSKDEMKRMPEVMHPQTVIAFFDPKPDKRLGGLKELERIATVKNFAVPKEAEVLAWAYTHAKALGTEISNDAAKLLLSIVGTDQTFLAHELQKLALRAAGRGITAQDVQELAVPSGEEEVFTLMNVLASGKSAEALKFTKELLRSGESPQALWGMLLWMLENLSIVRAASMEGVRNPAKIAQMGVPFQSVRTLLPLCDRIDDTSFDRFLNRTIDADIALKTGGYRATAEAPEELVALIDRYVLEACELGQGVRS